MFGLSEKGFKRKLYRDIEKDLFTRAKDIFGEDINLSERSPLGIFLMVIAYSLSLLWQVAERVYLQGHLHSSEGISLDYVCEKADIYRFPALKSYGEVKFTGTKGKMIYKGFKVGTINKVIFETIKEVQIGENGKVYADVRCLSLGNIGNVDANQINVIINPELDVSSVINEERFLTGREIETDEELRERYRLSFQGSGKATINAIIAHISKIATLKGYKVLENETMQVKNGMQPKSIKVIVSGGTDEEVGQAIFESKSAGIATNGNITYMATDNIGQKHEIKFSRATELSVYSKIDVTFYDNLQNKEDIKSSIKTSFKEYLRNLSMGSSVILSHIIADILNTNKYIKDISILIGKNSDNCSANNIILLDEEVATTTDDKIVINEV
ncbi:MAG: baseplate J/gp47 family protein [Peptoanaerobacter stomatis]|uniref:baseplate J/gp47 family protein n=1 Tax=Peptoanaerobacter stomatis TaxID=796937 RepID=UPI003F9F5558